MEAPAVNAAPDGDAAALPDSEDQFRAFADQVPGNCWLAGPDGHTYWMNRAALDFFGVGPGDPLPDAGVVHPDDAGEAAVLWARALASGEPVEMMLRLRGRMGYRPFLSRASPIRDADGGVARWCGVQIDMTERHAHDRRQAFLRSLHDRTRDVDDPFTILTVLAAMLCDQFGIDQMVYGEAVEGDRRGFRLIRVRDGRDLDVGDVLYLGPEHAVLMANVEQGRTVVVDADRPGRSAVLALAGGGSGAIVSVPIIKDGQVVAGLAVIGSADRRWSPDEVEMAEELAERAWTMVNRVRSEARLKERERHQRFLIEWSDALRWLVDPDAIMRETLERLGRHLGVARTTYSEADDERRVFTTRWDWCDGCPSLVGTRVAMAAVAPETEREWLAGDVVRYDDVTVDARADEAARAVYAERGIGAFISIPLIRHGSVRSILSVQSAAPRAWRGSEIDLIRDMGERTWVVLERARAQAELMERERNQAFLIAWGDRVRAESRPDIILDVTLAGVAEHLRASRATWSAVEMDGGRYTVTGEWCRDGAPTRGLSWPASNFSDTVRDAYLAGEALVSRDLTVDDRFSTEARARFAENGVVSRIGVPLARGGVVRAILAIDCGSRREWTRDEVQLVREIADRAWSLLRRARSEERLAESEALLAAFMEHAPLGMSLRDGDGRYLRMNPELGRQLGVAPPASVGRSPEDLLSPAAALRMTELGSAARHGTMASAEFDVPGRADYAALLAVEFPIGGGGQARTGGFTLDLTARKAAEAELARSREALFQTEKLSALGSLLAGVSHELNNPLSIVVAQAVMLERQGQGTELAERAFKIRKAADRCARIVQTFLAMARQKEPERTAVDLNAVAAAALELADYGLRSDGIAVQTALAPDLPRIAADADQLHQIIVNLVVNAQQALAGHDGRRRLTVTTARGVEPQTVTLDVADSGPGIPDEVARRIFEPFFTTKPQGEGTGVGLSFSLGLAEAHGGRLALVPDDGGARFRLTLPIDAGLTLPRVAPEVEPVPLPPTRRALLVDDEEEIAEALGDFLSLEGYFCEIATGGEEACAALLTGEYDLVVSDLRMPGMDGPALHAWVLAERPALATRMGFVTGDTLGTAVAQFLDETRRPVLEKPFTPDAVHRFLRQFDR